MELPNTKGGKILLGVDNNANVVGLDKNQNQRIEGFISDHIQPEISVILSNVAIDEKDVTIIEVPEGKDKPYVLKDHGPYKRIGATDKIFSRLDYEKMKPIKIEYDSYESEYYR